MTTHAARGNYMSVVCGATVMADKRTYDWREVTCATCLDVLALLDPTTRRREKTVTRTKALK
jgi:hypothetical protein